MRDDVPIKEEEEEKGRGWGGEGKERGKKNITWKISGSVCVGTLIALARLRRVQPEPA
jgi:hypothetical protein